MTVFERALAHTLGIEGDFSDDPADSGGATRYGITEAVARKHGYAGSMKSLPLDVAKTIYWRDYWNVLQLEIISALSERLAFKLFDLGVNAGVGFAAASLQRSLNILNRGQADYPDMSVDGGIGTVTIRALHEFYKKRGQDGAVVLLSMINCIQGAHYIYLAERRPKDEKFVYGWFRQRITV